MATRNAATLLALETAVPELVVPQEEAFKSFADLYAEIPQAEGIFKSAGVRKRHICWHPRNVLAGGSPLTGDRVKVWQNWALGLSRSSVGAVLKHIGLEKIGSFGFASCTGYSAPSPDIHLAKEFGLSRGIRRTFVGHMGCCAAFNLIKLGLDALAARPDELVLLTCTEICTVHIRPEKTLEQVVLHALFGDASGSLVLGNAEPSAGPQFVRTHTETFYEGIRSMTWSVMNDGFRMTLSRNVPFLLAKRIPNFIDDLLNPVGLTVTDVKHWGIHPGGPKIVAIIGQTLGLSSAQLRPAYNVLAEYGNCSSVTILLVLKEIIDTEKPRPGEFGVLMAFGPGLTMEGLLVRF